MKIITIIKRDQVLKGKLSLPSSKSISNRLLIIRAMTPAGFSIHNLSESADTVLLQQLLAEINLKKGSTTGVVLDTGNAGTVMRFLTAYLAFQPGKWILGGSERMKQRPVSELVDALKSLGAEINYLSAPGFPPLVIQGNKPKSNQVTIDSGISSQFISALLMTGPSTPGGLIINLKGTAVSFPYIDMTIRIMDYFGVKVCINSPPLQGEGPGVGSFRSHGEGGKLTVPHSDYIPRDFLVESDWSAAAFWYEAAALADEVDLVLQGLLPDSIQGDSILAEIFRNFGVQTEFTIDGIRLTKMKNGIKDFYFDFTNHPDLAPALITTCAALGLKGKFEGLRSLKIKESDRVNVLRKNYEMLGISLVPSKVNDPDPVIEFDPEARYQMPDARCQIDSSGDHRIAMAFAPLAIKMGSIRIEDPDVVVKSYPRFWEDLQSLGFEIS